MSTKTKKAIANRDFNDAGTGQAFEKDKSFDLSEGQFKNYAAAGLVREPDAKPAPTA